MSFLTAPMVAIARSYGASVFDPATLPLTGWWRASFSGSPWAAVASAGTSGANGDLAEATTPPATGAAVNGHTPADFDGSDDKLSVATALTTFFSTTAWTIVVLFNADTAQAYGADEYDNESLLSTAGAGAAEIGMAFSSNGVSVWHVEGADWPGVTVACATGGWHLARAKYDGTNIKLSIDSGAYSPQAAGNVSTLAETLQVGVDWGGVQFFDGKIAEIMFADTALSDANLDNIKSYINARYALSL